jgi:predicted nucleic acid-binding protein
VEQAAATEAPLLVCEPVLTEAMHLLRGLPRAQAGLLAFVESGALKIVFRLDEHLVALRKLHQRYQDVPMSLADACIVRMAELNDRYAVFTADTGFVIYRKHGRTPIALIHPTTRR